MLWEFKNYKNATEIAKKILKVYGQCVITDQVQNWFSMFCSSNTLSDEPRPSSSSDLDQDT